MATKLARQMALKKKLEEEYREANEDGTRKDAILKSHQAIDGVHITNINHENKATNDVGVGREKMIINKDTSIERLKTNR